jgi:hypothetical protein
MLLVFVDFTEKLNFLMEVVIFKIVILMKKINPKMQGDSDMECLIT